MNYDPRNSRVALCREKRVFNNVFMKIGLVLTILGLLIGGGALIFLKNSVGWTLAGLAAVPGVMLVWIFNALKEVAPGKNGELMDLLSEELLGLLSVKTGVGDLAGVIAKTGSGRFLMARAELAPEFFAQIVTGVEIEAVYAAAVRLARELEAAEITGALLAAAVIEAAPEKEKALRYFQLAPEDIKQIVKWYNYLNGLVRDAGKPVRTGGIARDLAFGYVPTLQRFGVNLSGRGVRAGKRVQQAENYEIFEEMTRIFSHQGRQNVALVGPTGAGKSSIVYSFAEELMRTDSGVPRNLKYRQIYLLDVSALVSAAKNPGDLEYLLIKIFNEVYSAKNIILCLDNAQLFFEEGTGSVDVSNLLIPVLEAGTVRMILMMEEQKFLEISAKKPALSNALNRITVHPTDYEETLRILMDQTPVLEGAKNVLYTWRALTEAYRLGTQYVHDVAMPGQARMVLEAAASFARGGVVGAETVAEAVEKSYGVKIKVATGEEERGKLLNLEELIHRRMIDQTEAVAAVSNALRRAAAGIKNQKRPIGTFLFLGPTGVGKTELAKALAATYFDGEENIVRLDMNEFVTAGDVSRLIRDGAEDGDSLTAQVMKRPFSVVLLDEIEKAHPAVLTTLLQVLDEGILRDERNREVSFRDCIMIATSNAGAEEIREKVEVGGDLADFREELVEKLIEKGEFKAEFLNRFDEICLFSPLSREDLMKVLELMIMETNRTLENQKIEVVVEEAAKEILIERGYNPKMGARPMRRMVQKTVENIVAAAILSGAAVPGTRLVVTAAEIVGES